MSERIDWNRVVCVTNRHLCDGPLEERMKRITACRPRAVILREKDMEEKEYEALAARMIPICRSQEVPVILHSFFSSAVRLRPDGLHLPLSLLRRTTPDQRRRFRVLGTSCHSLTDVQEAAALGCSYILAGHIYATSCKQGLSGRGIDFLAKVCADSPVPVYAIGGITPQRLPEVLQAGAAAACVMSGLMSGELWLEKADKS